MKFELFRFDKVTSTNDVAISLIKNEQKVNGCVYADTQTEGRGTHGKKWISMKGNLFTTIFFCLKENYPSFVEFSIINPIIISDVIRNFCKDVNIKLKYPNDIFMNGKKISGVLQELITLKDKKFIIIGIGINILSNPNIYNAYKATNLQIETKQKQEAIDLVNFIIFSYEKFFVNLNSYNYINFKKKAESMSL